MGEKITRLIQYATRKSLPLIICCASGGARMQEGSFSLMQMGKISSTLLSFQFHENLFLVSLLTSPTTGGVSFGMLGDIIIGEPDATIAFAGEWLEKYREIQTLFYYINKIPSEIEKKKEISKKF